MLHDPKTKNDTPSEEDFIASGHDDVLESDPDEIIESEPEMLDEEDFDEDNSANEDASGNSE
jgi:hypothetical protein